MLMIGPTSHRTLSGSRPSTGGSGINQEHTHTATHKHVAKHNSTLTQKGFFNMLEHTATLTYEALGATVA